MGIAPGHTTAVAPDGAIETSAHAQARIKTENGLEIELRENTRVSLNDMNGAEPRVSLHLDSGAIRCVVPHLADGHSFSVVTPDARVVDRGTIFTVSVMGIGAAARTVVRVEEGMVVVQHASGETQLTATQSWGSSSPAAEQPIVVAPIAGSTESVARGPAAAGARRTVDTPKQPKGTLGEETSLLQLGLANERKGDLRGAAVSFESLLSRYPRIAARPRCPSRALAGQRQLGKPAVRGRLRGVSAIGLVFAANAGCGSDVSVQLLPGDNQALTIGDAAAQGCGDRRRLQDGDPCSCPRSLFPRPLRSRGDPRQSASRCAAGLRNRSFGSRRGATRAARCLEPVDARRSKTSSSPSACPSQIKFAELPSTEPVPSHVLATWGFVKPDLWITTIAPTRPSVGVWHHLASSYGGGSLRLYVDGKRVGSMDSTEKIANGGNSLFIGATSRSEHAFDPSLGTSWWAHRRLHRRGADLVEEPLHGGLRPRARLTPDASTIGLWHLDEASGNVAVDSGPESHERHHRRGRVASGARPLVETEYC